MSAIAQGPERHVSEVLADELWPAFADGVAQRPPSPRPTLVVFAGVPLSGKTTLARALVARAKTRTHHVENDALRPAVAARLGSPEPKYSSVEHHVTYRTAGALAARALAAHANAVHDATNLDERWRRGAYDVAEATGAPVIVLFLLTPEEARDERAARVAGSRLEAHAKLGSLTPAPGDCSRPHVVLDGARPIAENVAALERVPGLAPLFSTVP